MSFEKLKSLCARYERTQSIGVNFYIAFEPSNLSPGADFILEGKLSGVIRSRKQSYLPHCYLFSRNLVFRITKKIAKLKVRDPMLYAE